MNLHSTRDRAVDAAPVQAAPALLRQRLPLPERPRDAEQNGASGSFKSLIFWIQEEVIRLWLWQIANYGGHGLVALPLPSSCGSQKFF